MICTKCQKNNEPNAKFCLSCGNNLQLIVCSQCGNENEKNAKFCLSCGSNFKTEQKEPKPSVLVESPPKEKLASSSDTPEEVLSSQVLSSEDLSTRPLVYSFLAHSLDGKKFNLPSKPQILLGRLDQVGKIFPDIDLTFMDEEKKVSRKHAHILTKNNTFFLVDLGSVNGTFINEMKCDKDKEYPIKNNDVLVFGELSFTFHTNL
jgi:ribosomal protein L40E